MRRRKVLKVFVRNPFPEDDLSYIEEKSFAMSIKENVIKSLLYILFRRLQDFCDFKCQFLSHCHEFNDREYALLF